MQLILKRYIMLLIFIIPEDIREAFYIFFISPIVFFLTCKLSNYRKLYEI